VGGTWWKDDTRWGNGYYLFADGSTLKGFFEDSNISGKADFTDSTGKTFKGTAVYRKQLSGPKTVIYPEGVFYGDFTIIKETSKRTLYRIDSVIVS